MDSTMIVVIPAAFTFVFGLLGIIYNKLNKDIQGNLNHIDKMRETYATKEELKEYKDDHSKEHEKQDKAIEKVDGKLDQIIQMLLRRKKDEN